jgi:hypothetical protein
VLSAVKDGPGDLAGVLALEEERLGLAVLETEDLAVTTDEKLALLHVTQSASRSYPSSCCVYRRRLLLLLRHVVVGGGAAIRTLPG